VTESAIKDHRLKIYPVGTLLVAMYGEGKTRGQVSELAIDATINQACAAVLVDQSLAARAYVKLALQANYLEMRELAEGGNQPNLNLTKIKEFSFLLPLPDEQHEIATRVGVFLEYVDRFKTSYQGACSRIEALTRAILAKAFQGELVPQDPSDEPAGALLQRIKTRREEAVKVARPKRQAVRRTAVAKITKDSLKAAIRALPESSFTFEELQQQVPTEYDTLRDLLFDLLDESKPVLKQIFDQQAQSIRLLRVAE
jgi:type I restriction enzyme, S subunit